MAAGEHYGFSEAKSVVYDFRGHCVQQYNGLAHTVDYFGYDPDILQELSAHQRDRYEFFEVVTGKRGDQEIRAVVRQGL